MFEEAIQKAKENVDRRITGRNVRRISAYGIGLSAALLVLAPVHPFGNAKVADRGKELMTSAQMGKPVLEVLERSCQNCHSERTVWPLYSRLPPISWLIEKDVVDGRSHWNMSKWEQYSAQERERILSRMGPLVRNKQMPLRKYLFLHPEAKLSDADAELLYQWSRQERKRLRSQSAPVVPSAAEKRRSAALNRVILYP